MATIAGKAVTALEGYMLMPISLTPSLPRRRAAYIHATASKYEPKHTYGH